MEMTKDDPLNVFVHVGPDGFQGLYTRQNRRLAAFLMYQVMRHTEIVRVRCVVRCMWDHNLKRVWYKIMPYHL